ncbi:MAG: cyclic nucleotide-binding domain-containing protein [Actinomycetota bacterium]|nr:cyclic nucleotide-binding domain-containing protein [Actinomycetota bacterium]
MKMTTRRARTNRTERIVAETSDWVPTTVSSASDAASALSDAPLFVGCAQDTIARALTEFDEVRFPIGRRVVLEGLRGSDFFLVVAGTALVLVDGWRVATLGPGDFFGEIAILGDGLRSASVRAETPLHCLVLPNGKLESLILDHPQLGINLIRTVIGRYQRVAGRRQPPASELAS